MRRETLSEITRSPFKIDRIQATITPNYLDIISVDPVTKLKFSTPLYSKHKDFITKIRKDKKLQYSIRKDSSGKKAYWISILSDYPYLSNIQLNSWAPFNISFQFNFTRYIKEYASQYPSFNTELDKQVFLDDNNYLDKHIWVDWDYHLISELTLKLQETMCKLATNIFKDFTNNEITIPNYRHATINQIETNFDFNVGPNLSLTYMEEIRKYLNNPINADKFRSRVNAIFQKCRIPSAIITDTPTKQQKNETISYQFTVCQGLKFKIYRKTQDDIRVELTFTKKYLKKKFKNTLTSLNNKPSVSCSVSRLIEPITHFTKDFFKHLQFQQLLNDFKECIKPKLLQSSPVYNAFRQMDPCINDIISAIINHSPITNPDTIKSIGGKTDYRRHFKRSLTDYGRTILNYTETPLEQHPRPQQAPYTRRSSPKVSQAHHQIYSP